MSKITAAKSSLLFPIPNFFANTSTSLLVINLASMVLVTSLFVPVAVSASPTILAIPQHQQQQEMAQVAPDSIDVMTSVEKRAASVADGRFSPIGPSYNMYPPVLYSDIAELLRPHKRALYDALSADYGDYPLLAKKEMPGVLRFGKRSDSEDAYSQLFRGQKKAVPGVLRFGKRGGEMPGVLRFGKRDDGMPGVLRFGKREMDAIPGVLRFGKRGDGGVPGVLRFGKRPSYGGDIPGVLRFGKK